MSYFSLTMHLSLYLLFVSVFILTGNLNSYSEDSNTSNSVPVYGYRVINTYPHDPNAFTQGLVMEDGFLYESTGLYGHSTIRKVDLRTGKILAVSKLPQRYFGEGITIFDDKIIQLTWHSKVGFVYDVNNFNILKEFSYRTRGWGITNDGRNLIMSDGSSSLYLLDPHTFEQTGQIHVHQNGVSLRGLNELEYVDGNIFANVWRTDLIAIIKPGTGRVMGWIDLKGILNPGNVNKKIDVLNGIAYDNGTKRLFVTGKLWPNVFEIEIEENQ